MFSEDIGNPLGTLSRPCFGIEKVLITSELAIRVKLITDSWEDITRNVKPFPDYPRHGLLPDKKLTD